MAQRETEDATELKTEAGIGLCAGDCAFSGTTITIGPSNPGRISSSRSLERAAETESTSVECGDRKTGPKRSGEELGRGTNRCFCCRKRVGLTGFRCRCGELFCGNHRYSDRHVCTFDYKSAGREEIARANPVVRAAKIIRI